MYSIIGKFQNRIAPITGIYEHFVMYLLQHIKRYDLNTELS
jgi:hypothetical protein